MYNYKNTKVKMKKYLGILALLFVGIFAYYGCRDNSQINTKVEQQMVDLESYKTSKLEELKSLGKYDTKQLEEIKAKFDGAKDKSGIDGIFAEFSNFDFDAYKIQMFEKLKATGKYSTEELENIKAKLFAVKDKLGFDSLFTGFSDFDFDAYKTQMFEKLKATGKYSAEELESMKAKLFEAKDKMAFDGLFDKYKTLDKSDDKKTKVAGKSVTVLYGVNVFTLTENQKAEIKAAVESNEFTAINVIGYTDMTGNKEYNRKLSEKRALFVKTFLTKELAVKETINANGEGQVGTGKENRKVEIEFVK